MNNIELLESRCEEQIALLNLEIAAVKCKQLEQKAEARFAFYVLERKGAGYEKIMEEINAVYVRGLGASSEKRSKK